MWTNGVAALMLAGVMLAPSVANADHGRNDPRHRAAKREEWRNIAIASGAVAVAGLIIHDDTVAAAGAAGALYSGYRYGQERQNESRYSDRYNRDRRYDDRYDRDGRYDDRYDRDRRNDNRYDSYARNDGNYRDNRYRRDREEDIRERRRERELERCERERNHRG